MKRILPLLLLLLLLAGCGLEPIETLPTVTARPVAPSAEPTPEPSLPPLPTPEPEAEASVAVTVDGVSLPGGGLGFDGLLYIRARELAEVLGIRFTVRGDAGRFEDGAEFLPLSYGGEMWVPLGEDAESLFSFFFDEEENRLYCTRAAADWPLEAGYSVPILMYHGVTDELWGNAELFVSPSEMEKQLSYLAENGYTPIFFEDLAYIADIEKPVLLTFEDGYEDNYRELFPLLQKYGMKATVFLITDWIGGEVYLTEEEITEMAASGLVSFQSHGTSHADLTALSEEELCRQMSASKLTITRLTGREPYVFCYPNGARNETARERLTEYYRFGVVMGGERYVTGSDPTEIPRSFVGRKTDIWAFAAMLA